MPVPAAWRDFQLREWTAFAVFGCAIVSAVVAWSGVASRDVALAAEYACYGLVVAAVVAAFRLALFRCPRCGHLYNVRLGPWPYRDRKPSSRFCLNCLLPKWADPARLPVEAVVDENDDW